MRRLGPYDAVSIGWEREIPYKWMAPEVLNPPQIYSKLSDVYSLGVTLYEIYAQRKPYSNMDWNIVQSSILRGDESPLLLTPPSLMPAAVVQIYKDCLSFDPKKRRSMSSILASFNNICSVE